MRVKRQGYDESDWMLNPLLHQEILRRWLKSKREKFTVDCAASMHNAFYRDFYSETKSFFDAGAELLGRSLWCNPPYRRIEAFVNKFVDLQAMDSRTSMCLVVPCRPEAKWWKTVTKHFKLESVISKHWRGPKDAEFKHIFSRPKATGSIEREEVRAPPWDVAVFWSKPAGRRVLAGIVEPTIAQLNQSFHNKATKHERVRGLYVLQGSAEGKSVSTLLDSGAMVNCISSVLVKQLGLTTEDIDTEVSWLTHSKLKVTKAVPKLEVVVAGSTLLLKDLLVLPLQHYDVIAGMPFHEDSDVVAYYGRRVITLTDASGVQRQLSPSRPAHLNSVTLHYLEENCVHMRQLNKEIKQGAQVFTIQPLVTQTDEDLKVLIDKAISPDCSPEYRKQLKELLLEFIDVFRDPTELPESNEFDLHLKLKEGAAPHCAPPYRMSKPDLEELATRLAEMLALGWITPSKSPWGSPCLFVRKDGKKPRFVIDYRMLNERTHGDAHPLPRIEALLDRLQGCATYSKMDLSNGFHQVLMTKASQEMTAFSTELGHYHWVVMPQGIKQGPGTFQRLVNARFRGMLQKKTASCYLDDLLVHNKNDQTHLESLRESLTTLRTHNLRAKLSKCEFGASKISFLGHQCSLSGVTPEQSKQIAIKQWPRPETAQDLHAFLGLASWFRRFVPNFAKQTKNMTDLLTESKRGTTAKSKNTPLAQPWSEVHEKEFVWLKEALLSDDCCLPIFDESLETSLWVDASEYALGGCLMQKVQGYWRPVGFYSRRLSPHELNYDVRDKELTSAVANLEAFQHHLLSLSKPFLLITDHRSLGESWATTKLQHKRHIRAMEKIFKFNFKHQYKRGEENVVADALSRRPDYFKWFSSHFDTTKALPRAHTSTQTCFFFCDKVVKVDVAACDDFSDDSLDSQDYGLQDYLPLVQVGQSDVRVATVPQRRITFGSSTYFKVCDPPPFRYESGQLPSRSLLSRFTARYNQEVNHLTCYSSKFCLGSNPVQINFLQGSFPADLMSAIVDSSRKLSEDTIRASGLVYDDSACLYRDATGRIYVDDPDLVHKIIVWFHTTWFHLGAKRTYAKCAQYFTLPNFSRTVSKVVKTCEVCQSGKTNRQPKRPAPMPTFVESNAQSPQRPFEAIGLDFVWGLPAIDGYSGIFVMTDYFSKMVRYLPVRPSLTSLQCAQLLSDHWSTYYGQPREIVSDNDVRFVSQDWKDYFEIKGTKLKKTSVYHPRANGQVERANCFLVDLLKCWKIDNPRGDWRKVLPWIAYSVNSTPSAATGKSAFEIAYGFQLADLPALSHELTFVPRDDVTALHKMVREMLSKQANLQLHGPDVRVKPIPTVGDMVYLSTEKLKMSSAKGSKLVPRWIGPFKVLRVSGSSVELDLPSTMLCRRVWNAELIKAYHTGDLPILPQESTHGFNLSDLVSDSMEDADVPSDLVVEEVMFANRKKGVDLFRVRTNQMDQWKGAEVLTETQVKALPGGVEAIARWTSTQRSRRSA